MIELVGAWNKRYDGTCDKCPDKKACDANDYDCWDNFLRDQQVLVDKAIAEAQVEALLEVSITEVTQGDGNMTMETNINKIISKYADRAEGSNPFDDGYDALRLLKKTPTLDATIERNFKRKKAKRDI